MLFDSIDFIFFLPITFFLYWFVFNQNIRIQNFFVVVASALFYGWWSSDFLLLIAFSILVDYGVGRGMARTANDKRRKQFLYVSVFSNLGLLFYFKYYNFFIENFVAAFTFLGGEIDSSSLNIILPVGISFYTFQTLSYTIDVYRRSLEPSKDLIAFAAFVSFFPQLVAGPIERAKNLLPQFSKARRFTYDKSVDGLRQILWGLFKKVVIANTSAQYANMVFDNSELCNGSTLALGVLFFAFQIYGDFSGYSDIAIGTARLFGFELKRNFAFPFFARDIREFWQRWHISLSAWFRDYLYFPLGGSKYGTLITIRNVFIVYIVSGFWHGASWNYIVWGVLNAAYFLPIFFLKSKKHKEIVAYGRLFPSIKEFLQMTLTFLLCLLSWVFFRAESIPHAINFLDGMFDSSLFTMPYLTEDKPGNIFTIVFISFIVLEWLGREGQFALDKWIVWFNKPLRFGIYLGLALLIFYFSGTSEQFIYFQF